MIGTILLAVIGYGLAVNCLLVAILAILSRVTPKVRFKAEGQTALEAFWGNVFAAVAIIVITRWLTGV